MAAIPTTKTNNLYFSGTNTGNSVLDHAVYHIIIHVSTANLSIGFDNTNFMPLTAGNHVFNNIHAKTIYMSGTGVWSGWGLG